MDTSPFPGNKTLIGTNINKLPVYDYPSMRVYTTRLDDMTVFKRNMKSLNVAQLTKCITTESCPIQVTPKSDKCKKTINIASFIILKKRIEQFNLKVKKEAHARNQKLLRICKPMSVVLKDLYQFKSVTQPPVNQRHIKSNISEEDEDLSRVLHIKSVFTNSDSHGVIYTENLNTRTTIDLASGDPGALTKDINLHDENNSTLITFEHSKTQRTFKICDAQKIERYIRKNSVLRKYVKEVGVTRYRRTFIVIVNLQSNETDVYYVNTHGFIIEYYRAINLNTNKLATIFPNSEVNVTISYCCWFQREKCCKLIFNGTPSTTEIFVKTLHGCKPGKCTCCCKIDTQSAGKRAKKKVSLIDNNSVIQVLETDTASNQMREDALKPKIPQSTDEWLRNLLNKESRMILPYVSLINKAMIYTPIVEVKQVTELSKKEGLRCAKIVIRKQDKTVPFPPCSIDFNVSYYVGVEGDLEIYLKRRDPEKLIDTLIKPYILEPVLQKRNDFCYVVCCWYKRENLSLGLRLKKLLPTAIKFIRTPHMCPVGRCTCCCKPAINPKLMLKDIELPNVQKHTNDHNTKLKYLKMVIDKEQVHGRSNVQSAANIATQESAKVQKLLSILKKFSDLRLGIDAQGKLSAELKTPINSLSSIELKCLSTIISFAQKQVTALGLTPGTKFNLDIDISSNIKDIEKSNNNDCKVVNHIEFSNANSKESNNMQKPSVDTRSLMNSLLSSLLVKKNLHCLQAFELYFRNIQITDKPILPCPSDAPRIVNFFSLSVSSDVKTSDELCTTDSSSTLGSVNPRKTKQTTSKIKIGSNSIGVKRKFTDSKSNAGEKHRKIISTNNHSTSNSHLSQFQTNHFKNTMTMLPHTNYNNPNIKQLPQTAQRVPISANQTSPQSMTLRLESIKQTNAQKAANVVEENYIGQVPIIGKTPKMFATIPVPRLANNYYIEVSNATSSVNALQNQKQRTDGGISNDGMLTSTPMRQPNGNSMLLKLINSSHVPPHIIPTNLNEVVSNQNVMCRKFLEEVQMTSASTVPANAAENNINLEATINLIRSSTNLDDDCILGV